LLLALSALAILAGIVAVFSGQARGESLSSPVWLLAGPAEILCLLAAAILGKEKYQKLTRKVRRSARPPDAVRREARLRYYLGLAGCLFNGVPLTLYAYVPGMLPGGTTKAGILVIADVVFFVSLFCAGGEFWEKLRRIFVWEGDQCGAGFIALGIFFLGADRLPAQDVVELLREQQVDFVASPPATPWWEWDAATGDWFGARTSLQDRGIELFGGYNYTLQCAIPTSGSGASNWIYSGMLDYGVQLDLDKLVGWPGASVQTTWLWIHGNTMEESLQDDLLISSDLAGFNTFRMLDLWFQQNLLDEKISIRVGQFTADSEFVRSAGAGVFLNRSLGWPALLAANLPGGGPSVPLATLGLRLAVQPTDRLTLQFAIFQGNVYDQNTNPYGFLWNLNRDVGFFLINEAQWRWHPDDTGLPGQIKAGFWVQTGRSANPLAATTNHANFGGYVVLDQMLYREPNATGTKSDGKTAPPAPSPQGLGWFGRIGGAPPERSIVGFYFDTGLFYTGLIPTRDADTFGIAFAYGELSSGAAQIPTFRDSYGDGYQMVLELTYRAQITRWMTIQPDVQFIISPGSSLNNDNAIILGGSMAIRF